MGNKVITVYLICGC